MDDRAPTDELPSASDAVPVIRIFISSPGDVSEERALALAVIRKLQGPFQGRLLLDPFLWEEEPLGATGGGFQDQIDRRQLPSASDIALFVLWSRVGSTVSPRHVLPDGREATGTEWEFEDARRGNDERGTPFILVYRKTAEPPAPLEAAARRALFGQMDSLDEFFLRHFRDEANLSFTGAFHRFSDAAEFGEMLETHLTSLLRERLYGTPDAARVVTWHESPFRGLQPFHAEHARIFFGRTRAAHGVRQALCEQARAERAFVLVLGTSGSGKSSLVQAGVLPLLDQPGVVEEGLRGGTCRHAVMRPGAGNPLEALAVALCGPGALPELLGNGPAADLAATLADGDRGAEALLREVRGALGRVTPSPARLVLVVDQLEELFTAGAQRPAERDAFVAVLEKLAGSGLVYSIATLRSDFYPAFQQVPGLMKLKAGAGHFDLTAPGAAEVAQIIRGPAQVAGLAYERDPATNRFLDEVILDDASGGPDALPLLEYLLSELYERRENAISLLTFEAYRALGGVEGALATRAESVWNGELTDAERSAFPAVVRALVDVSAVAGRAVTRRWATWEEATRATGARTLVEKLVTARLLVADAARDGTPIVAVVHEALLRRWDRLVRQVEVEEGLLRTRTYLRAAAAAWMARGRQTDDLVTGRRLHEIRDLLAQGFDLSEEERAFAEAAAEQERQLHDVAVVADSKVVGNVREQAANLFPRDAASADACRRLLGFRGAIERTLVAQKEALDRVRGRGTPSADGSAWRFEDPADERTWQTLSDLVREAESVLAPETGALAVLERRFTPATTEDGSALWADVLAQIGDERANPVYRGLVMSRQWGLWPLGKDPDSGLFEFAHLYSGSLPVRGPAGRLVQAADAGFVFVLIPGGTFWMGAAKEGEHNVDSEASSDEGPVHEVTLSAFLLSKYQCTQAEWGRLTGGERPSHFVASDRSPGLAGSARRPVELVSWDHCAGRSGWLPRFGLRLPSEAQWEFACRAGSAGKWCFGDDEARLSEYAWYDKNSGEETHPVGERKPNAWGMYDMHGNVWEWCADARDWGGDYEGAPTDGSAWVRQAAATRVIRGGSWCFTAGEVRSSFRYGFPRVYRYDSLGFRPARLVAS